MVQFEVLNNTRSIKNDSDIVLRFSEKYTNRNLRIAALKRQLLIKINTSINISLNCGNHHRTIDTLDPKKERFNRYKSYIRKNPRAETLHRSRPAPNLRISSDKDQNYQFHD